METVYDDLREAIALRQEDALLETEVRHGELTVTVTPQAIPDFVRFLRTDSNCRFTTLIDITAVDWPAREKRFDMVYHFLSMHLNQRIRVKAEVREDELVQVLGTQLDVSEEDTRRRDPDDPDADRWMAYERLTRMLSQIVAVLS